MEKKTRIVLTIMIFINVPNVAQSLKLTLHKINMTYVNPKYLENMNFFIRRYGRRSDYYFNARGKKYHPWGNNVTYNLVAYEYLHNEYRRSFVEMHVGVCDVINHDIFVGQMLKKFHLKCPLLQNELELLNMTVPAKFPYKFPFEEFRLDCYLTRTDNQELILSSSIFCAIKQ